MLRRVLRGVCGGGRRGLLSPAYQCREEWEARLREPILAKLKPHTLLNEVEQKFLPQYYEPAYVGPVDVDLVVQRVEEEELMGRVTGLLYALRHTPTAPATLPSTHHGIVRTAIALANPAIVLDLLRDPINFGIFPDYIATNLLLDYLLETKDYKGGSEVGIYLMRQEMLDNPISTRLALLHVARLLESRLSAGEGKEDTETPEEEEEEVLFKVPWLKNRFWDGHFDLEDEALLLGKTLAWLPDPADTHPAALNLRLLGYSLWAPDSAEAAEFLAAAEASPFPIAANMSALLGPGPESGVVEAGSGALGRLLLGTGSGESVGAMAEEWLRAALPVQEPRDVEEMQRSLGRWAEEREKRLSFQLERLATRLEIEKLEEEKGELERREEELLFFRERVGWEKRIHPDLLRPAGPEESEALPADEDYVIPEPQARKDRPVLRRGDHSRIL